MLFDISRSFPVLSTKTKRVTNQVNQNTDLIRNINCKTISCRFKIALNFLMHIKKYLIYFFILDGDMIYEASSSWDLTETSLQKTKNSFTIYIIYIKYCGLFTIFMYILFTLGWQILRIITEFWLSYIVSSLNRRLFHEQVSHKHSNRNSLSISCQVTQVFDI